MSEIYLQRINLVVNYIREHLTEDLSLNTLAQVACFSPFHFHRIFSTMMGETLNQCVMRLRLERAVALLKGAPKITITQAAFECGFESVSVFSRAFKKRYGIAARTWDRYTTLKESKIGQVLDAFSQYTVDMLREVEAQKEFTVEQTVLADQHIAYIRVANSYQPPRVMDAYERLLAWYRAQGDDPLTAVLMGMSQDDPDVTPLELCQYDLCLTAPDDWLPEGEVSTRVFPACRIAYIHCVGDIYKVDRAWQYLYRYWLPNSRYQPDNLPALELYCRQPAELGWETYDLKCVIPIVDL